MKFLFLLMLLVSCGKKTVYTYPDLPKDQASPAEKSEIDQELERIEKDFADLDIQINLKKLPVVVAPLPFGVVGRCQYGKKNRGAYIVLSPNVFLEQDMRPADAHLYEKEFVRVLIHEIGHCYFYRPHEAPAFLESPGNLFELTQDGASMIFDKIPRSVMPAESSYRMPKTLRKYYLAEIAGRARLSDPVHLSEYAEFRMVTNGHTHPHHSDTIEATDKEGRDVSELFE